jgi:hypothetical protein
MTVLAMTVMARFVIETDLGMFYRGDIETRHFLGKRSQVSGMEALIHRRNKTILMTTYEW